MTDKDDLKTHINKKHLRYGTYRRRWGALHFLGVTTTIVCSWAAALILQLQFLADSAFTVDASTVLAAIAGLATALGSAFSFERKWRASFVARRKSESLQTQLTSDSANLDEIRDEIDEVYEEWAGEVAYNSR